MTSCPPSRKPRTDWLTVTAIAAIAISLTVALHEGVHALACVLVGGDLQVYTALAVNGETRTVLQEKIVAGSAPLFNLIAGTVLWAVIRTSRKRSDEVWYFLWLFMLMNFLYGAGYFIFSGIAGVGDIAVVIAGWEPVWFWRTLSTLLGAGMFMFFVGLALREFGKMIGGVADGRIGRANKLSLISYFTSLAVVLLAGLFNPLGFVSLPVIAGLLAVLGGLSPLLWMMQWFQAKMFPKHDKEPLTIRRRWVWIGSAAAAVFLYTVVLGRGIYF